MGCQVDLAALLVRELVLAGARSTILSVTGFDNAVGATHLPLIEPNIILDKKQHLVGQIRRSKGCREVDLLQEHVESLIVHKTEAGGGA